MFYLLYHLLPVCGSHDVCLCFTRCLFVLHMMFVCRCFFGGKDGLRIQVVMFSIEKSSIVAALVLH